MKDSARKKDGRQEATAQLVFAAMIDAWATLHDAILSAGMSVLRAMLEEERTKLCGPRYGRCDESFERVAQSQCCRSAGTRHLRGG